MKIRNTFIIFILSGFWHGANWTFIVWGALNAIYFLPLLVSNRNRVNLEIVAGDSWLPTMKEIVQMGLTFGLTVLAWIFFRSESLAQAWTTLAKIFSPSVLSLPSKMDKVLTLGPLILFLLTIEWLGRRQAYALEAIFVQKSRILRWGFYYSIAMLIFLLAGKEQQFIYFQF